MATTPSPTVFSKRYKNITRFTLWAEGPIEGRRAQLILGFRDGNPRFTVFTGVAGKDGIINFPTDVFNFAGFLAIFNEVIKGPIGTKYLISSRTTVYENDKPTNKRKDVSTLQIGKSQEGIIYFVLMNENHPKIIFPIKPSEFHIFTGADGNQLSDSFMSPRIATVMLSMMQDIISLVMVNHASEEINGADAINRSTIVDVNKKNDDIDISSDINY